MGGKKEIDEGEKALKRSIVRAFSFSSAHDVYTLLYYDAGACVERAWRFDIFERGQ